MAGPISKSDDKPHWAPREGPSGSGSRVSAIPEEDARTPSASGPERGLLFSPGEHRLAEESPAPLSPNTIAELEKTGRPRSSAEPISSGSRDISRPSAEAKLSAPTELFQPYRRISHPEQHKAPHTYDDNVRQSRTQAFVLDREGPIRRAQQVRTE